MKRHFLFRFILAFIPAFVGSAVTLHADDETGAEGVIEAPDYASRVRRCPQNHVPRVDSLALPLVHVKRVRPVKVAKGARPIKAPVPVMHRYYWRYVPWREGHEAFLTKYAEVGSERDRFDLVRWCDRNELPVCAEFVLRDILKANGDIRDRGYRKALRKWLKLADDRQSPFVFNLPVRGEWKVLKDRTRHHRIKHWATQAYDLVIERRGKSFRGNGRDNEDHYAWNQPVVAVADGVVISVTDEHRDVPPGRSGGYENANQITIDCGGGVYAQYGHLKKNSALVKKGEKVDAGDALGRIGNSGASGAPHLHFSLLDGDYFSIKGRYRYEVRHRGKWKRIDGEDMVEGTTIRPMEKQP